MGETRFLWGIESSVPSRFPSFPLLLTAACLGDGRNAPKGRPFGRCRAGGSTTEAHILGHLPLRTTRNLDKNFSISLNHHIACPSPALAFLPILLHLPEHRIPASGHIPILSLHGAPKNQVLGRALPPVAERQGQHPLHSLLTRMSRGFLLDPDSLILFFHPSTNQA